MLTPTASLNANVAQTITANKMGITEMRFFGGTSAVSQAVRTEVMNLLD